MLARQTTHRQRASRRPLVLSAGSCLAVEKCFDRTGVVWPAQDGALAQASDYLSPPMQDLADGDENCAKRVGTLHGFIACTKAEGALTVATMEAAVRLLCIAA